MAANGIDQRAQQRAGGTDPTGQQSPIKVDAFAGVNDGLAVQRQMIGELGHQDVRQRAGAGDTALDRTAWRRLLDDGVAADACLLGAYMTDHAEARRHEFQLLGDVLAQRPQAATTGRAGIGRQRVDLLVTRQMIGQGTPH